MSFATFASRLAAACSRSGGEVVRTTSASSPATGAASLRAVIFMAQGFRF